MTSPAWVRLSQHLVPKNLSSAIVYRLTRSQRVWLKRPLIRWFARAYKVDLAEAAQPHPEGYRSFNDFFTRQLKPGVRPLEGDAATIVAAADGVLTEFGSIDGERLYQAKGMSYSLADLVGETGNRCDGLRGGSYFTIYLAPYNYHRVHAPIAATLTRTRYLPGRRFSVSRATAAAIRNLFCRNERVVCWFDTEHGAMAVVMVGALNVSSISTFTRGEIPSGRPQEWLENATRVERGAEIGRFNMGSTVIVLLGPAAFAWNSKFATGSMVRVGQALGAFTDQASRSR